MPIWNQYRTIDSVENLSVRVDALATLMIRLGFELVAGGALLAWCRKRLPADLSLMLRTSVSKPVYCFYLGIAMYHMVAFFPRCQLCDAPQHCLLHLKCLRHGRFILDGREACRSSFGWTAQAVEDILHASNISRSDMGCDREQVWCPTLKQLSPGQACRRDARCDVERGAGIYTLSGILS